MTMWSRGTLKLSEHAAVMPLLLADRFYVADAAISAAVRPGFINTFLGHAE
jgi:hypothetical protein